MYHSGLFQISNLHFVFFLLIKKLKNIGMSLKQATETEWVEVSEDEEGDEDEDEDDSEDEGDSEESDDEDADEEVEVLASSFSFFHPFVLLPLTQYGHLKCRLWMLMDR